MLVFTKEEANSFIEETKKAFDVVRVVNASIAKPVDFAGCSKGMEGESCCFALWNRTERCENCITAKALAEKARVMKFEVLEDDFFFVVANYSEIDGKPYVIEVGVKLTEDLMLTGFGSGAIQNSINNYNHKMYRDTLTGVYNRQYYEEQVAARPVTGVAMLDMDSLKAINDSYGHNAGDLALQHLMSCVMENTTGKEKVVRFGGDEFVIAFENVSEKYFRKTLERMRKAVEEEQIPDYPDVKLSVSIGGLYGNDEVRNMLGGADHAMYRSKTTKNKVTVVKRTAGE